MNYFVQLNETGQTVNLDQVASVNWSVVPASWEDTECTATIVFASGLFVCIPPADAQKLWEALHRYNQRVNNSLLALPQLTEAVTNLLTLNEDEPEKAGEEQIERQPDRDTSRVAQELRPNPPNTSRQSDSTGTPPGKSVRASSATY